jgi:hypothetical protein
MASPKTFFLNEKHELSRDEHEGGGALPKYVDIEWAKKGAALSASILSSVEAVQATRDPLKEKRFFLVAQPDRTLKKRSEEKGKPRVFEEPADFGAAQSRVFDRLGLDLLQVTDDGRAVVHGEVDVFDRLAAKSKELDALGPREQSRWAALASFETIPLQIRVDGDWFDTLRPNHIEEVIFELQPVLTRVDADYVLRAIADLLAGKRGEQLTGTGTDFSGRVWLRGKAALASIRTVAKEFFSVQSVHPPQYSVAFASSASALPRREVRAPRRPVNPEARELPCVAVLDIGVPADHLHLAEFRRGIYVAQDVANIAHGDHASRVASRIVFGEHKSPEAFAGAAGECSFYDANIGHPLPDDQYGMFDKAVMEAISAVRGSAPDIRVFNLSFGDYRPIDSLPAVARKERRMLLQELDNFAFFNDVAIVVASGNSMKGMAPDPPYPKNHDDKRWALGPVACGFNTLICGAYVGQLSASGLAKTIGAPSPFTRVGPGLCAAPMPTFSAEGGNCTPTYQFETGLGVWCYSAAGQINEAVGTSLSAPILSREVAKAFRELELYCAPDTRPFAVTARAFLALTASRDPLDSSLSELADRTLGFGKASSARISTPKSGSAVCLWQGVLESVRDIVSVQIPVPSAWLAEAEKPALRLMISFDPPANEVAQQVWACRRLEAVLKTGPEGRSVRAPSGRHQSYTLLDRTYTKLKQFAPDGEHAAGGDMWILRLRYEEAAPYAPGRVVDPRQRVAFAAELIDLGDDPVDPQDAVQALPAAEYMVRLSAQPTPLRTPVVVRTRG